MNTLSILSPTVLKYLKTIADGGNPLDAHQAAEYNKFLLERFRLQEKPKEHGRLDFQSLLSYMSSSKSNALRPADEVDLDYPISSYFISSSHNTYLSGNQLYGESSTEAYRNVLLRGCRSVEIDVWDGEELDSSDEEKEEKHGFRSRLTDSLSSRIHKHRIDDKAPEAAPAAKESLKMPTPWRSPSSLLRAEPRVLHGYTLTKEVSFRAVCAAIRDAAFVTSNLPVIVSLEIHTCAEQQEVMVEIMREEWGDMLVEAPSEVCTVLPSPAALRGKILVKVKGAIAGKPKGAPAEALVKIRSESSSDSEGQSDVKTKKTKKKNDIIQALSALGIYTHSYHFKNLSAPEAKIPNHVFSLSEKKLIEVHQSQGPTLFSHNRNFLMRAFPSATRVSSSNLDPALFWRKGVQMVALNWQKWDAGMMLNEGMFGGGSGWVLKPKGYRASLSGDKRPHTENQADVIPHKSLNLSIEVFAAQDIPLPPGTSRPDHLHPYVKCELHVEKPEERSGGPIPGGGRSQDGEHKRGTKFGKGIEPDFGGEVMQFMGITGVLEELSFVR
ncbi:hypothetical protein MMC30_008670 [Trapelia coarctata]|nr:hypothetical protein [Trapelia coarctata]